MTELDVEWVDGFLFVGNQLALDFLNTKLLDGDELIEKLPDWPAFARWCIAAQIGAVADKGRIADVQEFRERLRAAVVSLERKEAVTTDFLKEVNSLLSRYPARVVLDASGGNLEKRVSFATEGAFWGAIAASVAELLTATELHRGAQMRALRGAFLRFKQEGIAKVVQHEIVREPDKGCGVSKAAT